MKQWHNIEINKIIDELNTNENGLSNKEAQNRLLKNGKNELPKKKSDSIFKIFFKQMIEPMEILLISAMIISFLIGETVDGCAIMLIIIVDLIMGSYQEWKANKTAESLSNLIKVKTKVLRDTEQLIDSNELVVGDIVLLESGNKVSADMRIIECNNLQIDESILTGESLPIYKTTEILESNTPLALRKNMIFAGTNVRTGRAKAVVVETGINTEVGKIAHQVNTTKEEKSPLTIRMEKFTKQITLLIIIVALIITFILLSKGTSISTIFLSVIALSISAMPEGLPLSLTMALTIASNRMSKKNVIVKKLNSAESLGSCTVIASDKTGTLTVNEQTAKKIVLPDETIYDISGTGYDIKGKVTAPNNTNLDNAYKISKLCVLNNEALIEIKENLTTMSGDSIDIAFKVLGKKLNVETKECQITKHIPYESENKYSAVYYKENNEQYCTVKGSLEIILDMCSNIEINNQVLPLNKDIIINQNNLLATQGYRVIAVAYKKITKDETINNLLFLGLVAFIDPVRTEVKNSIKECKTAGIKVLMITGDHPLTAFKIAQDLNITKNYNDVTTGLEVDEYLQKGNDAFDEFIKTKKVFTRVTPLNKLQIVESLKRQGEFVAVTGDGVNDAPAIKSANIGISMGSGTDVAKETSSLIILDDNFKSIVAGVKEGRNAYSNIRKISYMLLSCGVSEVLFFLLSIICNMPLPLVAVQLLWLNIVTDGLQDIGLSFEKCENSIMKEKPRPTTESIFNKELLSEILISGIVMGLCVFGLWIYLIKIINMDVVSARGYVMMLMVFMQNMHVLNCRSEKQSAFKIPLKDNWWVVFAIVSAITLQFMVGEIKILSNILQTTSIPLFHVLLLFMLSTTIIIVMEIYKKTKKENKI